jgi:hypothetical protein
MLECYYQLFCGKTGPLRSWHDYIQALQKVAAAGASPAPSPETIARIDEIRNSTRNGIMHPRLTLEEEEAMPLFSLAHAVICRMAQELIAARATGAVTGPVLVASGATP